jgi:hypothetical protein
VVVVEERNVVERGRVESRVELAVDGVQDVAVERRRHPGAVVVRGLEDLDVLDQIRAKEEMTVRAERPRQRAEKASPRTGQEVAERPAEQRDQSGRTRRRRVNEVALEVADDAVNLETVVLADQLARARLDGRLGHVDGDVAHERPGVAHGVEENACLRRVAGAQLDELARSGALDDVSGGLFEDRPLRAGRIVLGQLADPLEQLRAARVVEVLGRQLLERPSQSVEDVLGE